MMRERRLGDEVLVERVVQLDEGRRPRPDDLPRLLEQRVADVQPGHRRRGTGGTPRVLGRAVATAIAGAALVAEPVLAGAVLGMGGAPGAVVGRVASSPDLVVAVSSAIGGQAGRRTSARTAFGRSQGSRARQLLWAWRHGRAATRAGVRERRGPRRPESGAGGAAIPAPAGAGGKVRAGHPGRRDGAGNGGAETAGGRRAPRGPG